MTCKGKEKWQTSPLQYNMIEARQNFSRCENKIKNMKLENNGDGNDGADTLQGFPFLSEERLGRCNMFCNTLTQIETTIEQSTGLI